jgi:N,N'-diacetyllegionaminate synthase
MIKAVRVGYRFIGPGQPCFVAAEIGINHNGDLDLARMLIDAAADAGADGVKFQNYRTEDFIRDRSLTYRYLSQGEQREESCYEMFKRCELNGDDMRRLKTYCDERGVTFFSTPTSEDGVRDLVSVRAPLLKNGSDYLVHLPLIRFMAATGLPAVLSTGMAYPAEIDEAVRAFRDAGGKDLILLHCTSSYPTPPEQVNLRRIPVLASIFGCPAGLSDHTEGITAAIGAIALGACFIEKHFTLDKGLPGPDHRFSADPEEFRVLVDSIRRMEMSLGDAIIGPTARERTARLDFRLSCTAARPLPAGYRPAQADVVFSRPGTGLPPKDVVWILGRPLRRAVEEGKAFEPEDFF